MPSILTKQVNSSLLICSSYTQIVGSFQSVSALEDLQLETEAVSPIILPVRAIRLTNNQGIQPLYLLMNKIAYTC